MAVSGESLKVEVVVDSKGAVKGFRGLNGEVTSLDKAINEAEKSLVLAEKAMGSIGKAADGSAEGVERLAIATDSANTSTREFSQSQAKTRGTLEAVSQSITAMATSVSTLQGAYALLTSNETLSRLSKLLRVSALMADLKGYDSMAEKLRTASAGVIEFGVATNGASKKVDDAIAKYAEMDRTIEGVKDSVGGFLLTSAAIASLPFVPSIVAQTKATVDLGKAVVAAGGNFRNAGSESQAFVSALGNFKVAGAEAASGIMQTAKSSQLVASIIGKDFVTATQEVRKIGEVAKNVGKLGFLSLAEASLTAGTAVGALGAVLANFDNTTVKVTGAILVVAAALTGAFGVAVNMALGWVGRLVESIGDKMITAMAAFEEKAMKLQSVMQQFTFTVKGFNKVYGSEAVGSLEKWQKALEDTVETTTFTREEVAKAIKLMVAEGKTLGLSVKDTTALFEKSKDLAAATGKSLDDVVNRLISGLAGNSQAVLELGINTSETALNQLDLVRATGRAVSALSDQDKIMARLAEVFVATKPIAGAAAAAVITVAGAYAMLDKRLTEVQARLGEQGTFTTAYLTAFTRIAEAFLALPPSVIDAVGAIQDFLGVSLKVFGVVIQYALTITALTTAYTLLSGAVAKYALVQATLTGAFSLVGAQLGAQTIVVTSMANVWTNLAIVLRAGVATAFTAAGAAILAFGKGLLGLAAVAAPFIFAAVQLGAVVFGIVEGFRMVEKETKVFSTAMNSVLSIFGLVGQKTKEAADGLNVVTRAVKQFTMLLVGVGTLVVTSFVGAMNDVSSVLLKVAGVFVSFSETASAAVEGAIETARENSQKLAETSKKAIAVLASLGASTAFAASGMNAGADAADKYAVALRGAANASEAIVQLSREMEIARVQGNDAQALVLERQIIELKYMSEQEAKAKEDLATQLVRNQAQLQKTFGESIKSAQRAADETRKKLLEGSGTESSVKELIAIRKRLEGDATREQILKLKLVADESGAREAIKSLQAELAKLNDAIEEEELLKFAVAFGAPKIEASAKAMEGLSQVTQTLAKSLESARIEFQALASVKGFDAGSLNAAKDSGTTQELMKTFQLIELEKQRAIAGGANLRIAEERAAKAVESAIALSQEGDALERLEAIRKDMKSAEDAAEAGLKAARSQRMGDNETLLRLGMSKADIAARELDIENDKIDALEEQLRRTQKLDRFAQAELDLARKTAKEKAKVAAAPAAGSPESAVGIGAAAGAATSMAGSASPVGAFMAAAEMIVGIVQKLIDFIPNIINAVAKIFMSLGDLPSMIMKAFDNLVAGLINFTTKFLPGLFEMIPKIIDTIITTALDTLPDLSVGLIKAIPGFIEGFVKRIPELVEKLISGLISSSIEITMALIEAIIKSIPMLTKASILLVPALVKAIIKGVIKGVKDIGKAVSNMFKGAGKGITDGAKNLGNAITGGLKKLTGFKGDVFGVQDDVKAAGKTGSDLIKNIQGAGKAAYNWLAKAWAIIKAGFKWVYDTLLKPWVDFLKITWDFIWSTGKALFEFGKGALTAAWEFGKSMFDASIGLLKSAWNVINVGILKPFVSILKQTWEFIKTGIIDPIISAFMAVWQFAKSMFSVVTDTFQALWNFVKTLFDDPIKAFQNLWADFKAIFADVISAFSTLGSKLWDSMKAAFDAAVGYLQGVGTTIWNGLKAAWDAGIGGLADFGGKIWNSVKTAFSGIGGLFSGVGSTIWNSVTTAFSGIGDFFKNIFSRLELGSLVGKLFKDTSGKGKVEGFLGIDIPWLNFAEGGRVPGKARVFGDSRANDTQPALLSPGEAVIPRSLMQDPAVARLVMGLLEGKGVGEHAKGLRRVGTAIATGGLSETKQGGQAVEAVKSVAEQAGDWFKNLSGPAKSTFDFFKQFLGSIDVGAAFKDPLGYAKSLLQKFIGPIYAQLQEQVSGMFRGNAFAMGGIVPGSGSGDTVPAMLTPGEFVLKRSAADSIGSSALSALNQTGRLPQMQGGDVSVTLNVTTQQPVDEGFVRRTLMPTIKDEFKKASLRGEFVLSQKGVRS